MKKIGIIGCSNVAKKRFLPALSSSHFGNLSIIGSRSKTKAEEWSKEFGCKQYGDYQDVMNEDVDVVYISTPVGTHEELVMQAAKSGKHIICEKSSTYSYKSAKKMVKVCKENKVRIIEGFAFRFHPQHQKIIQLISNGRIGNIQTFSGSFGFPNPDSTDIRWSKELGGGVLNDAGCYPIYASRMIFNSEPIGVFGNIEFNSTKLIDIKIDAVLIFPQNKVAHITAGYDSYFQSKYKIWGTKGIISSNRAFSVSPNFITTIDLEQDDKVLTMEINPADQFSLMIDSFCSEISGEKSTFNFEEDLLSQAKILEAIRISDNEKRFVKLD